MAWFFRALLPTSQAGGGRTSAAPGEGGLARCNRRRRSLPFAVRARASERAGMVVAVVAACAVVIALGLFLLVGRPSCVEVARAAKVVGGRRGRERLVVVRGGGDRRMQGKLAVAQRAWRRTLICARGCLFWVAVRCWLQGSALG